MTVVTPLQVEGLQLALWSSPAPPTAPPAEAVVETELAAMLAEAVSTLSAEDRRYLRGPVVFNTGGDPGPDWLRQAIPMARLRHLRTASSEERGLATLEEALAVIASASLAFPLAEDDATLFFWLGQEICPQYGLARDEPVWKSLGHKEPLTLSPYLQAHLRDLRAKIRAAVIKHARRAEADARLEHRPKTGARQKERPYARCVPALHR